MLPTWHWLLQQPHLHDRFTVLETTSRATQVDKFVTDVASNCCLGDAALTISSHASSVNVLSVWCAPCLLMLSLIDASLVVAYMFAVVPWLMSMSLKYIHSYDVCVHVLTVSR